MIHVDRQLSWWCTFAPSSYDKSYLSDLWKVDPDTFKFFNRHGSVAESGIGQEHLIANSAAVNKEMIIADRAHGDDERSEIAKVLELQIPVANSLVATAVDESLQVE